jgi:putative aminopeptidase FrvX
MDKQKTINMIASLSAARGVSGFEDEVVNLIRSYTKEFGACDEDSMRNLYVKPNETGSGANKPVLLLDAHTDEVGFVVKSITPNGMLEFVPLGGWAAHNVAAHRVQILNKDGVYVTGIISSKPPHYMTEAERNAPPKIESMLIDVGASSAKEMERDFKIGIASPAVPDAAFEFNSGNGTMSGKAFDDRLGCAAIISVLQELRGKALDVSITAGFAAQEEVGLRGAQVTAQTVHPDAAICFEGAPADDSFAARPQTALHQGPMLRHLDSKMITNPRFQRFALDAARQLGIPVQEAVRTGGSTNAGAIHLAGKAIPVIVISLPVRYAHTHYGIASYSDYENTVKLGAQIIKSLNASVIAGF